MLWKILFFAFLAACVGILLVPAVLPRLLRRAGRGAGDVRRAGQELVTGKEVRGSPLARYEAAAGKEVEGKFLARFRPSDAPELQARVGQIGGRLAMLAHRREIPYRFLVVEDPEPNAYSIPGGTVLVGRTLLDLCGADDNQLAGLLAHELVHIDRRHAIRHLAAGAAARTGLKILTFGRGALLGRAVGALESLMANGYSSDQEMEADRFGVQLAAVAGFDPRAYSFFLRTALDSGMSARGYFRTHPPIPERLRNLGG